MTAFPLQALSAGEVTVSVQERYTSAAVNRQFAGQPLGVYRGWTPTVTGALELTLNVDPTFGDSLGMAEAPGAYVVQGRMTSPVVLDFTGHASWPVYVVLEVVYVPPPPLSGASSGATIKTVASPTFPSQVKICKVDWDGGTITVATAVPAEREEPFAFSGVTAGYMPGTGFPRGGAIEELQAAADTTDEVVAARTGPSGAYASLDERLDAEFAGPSMADRLAKVPATSPSLLYPNAAPFNPGWTGAGTTANVSQDFEEIPASSGGSEGVVVDLPDNYCEVLNDTYDQYGSSVGRAIFGRLTYESVPLTGTLTFTQANDQVTGVGTLFQDEIEAGDIIQTPYDTYRTVKQVNSQLSLTLEDIFPDDTISSGGMTRRRFTLTFYSQTGPGVLDVDVETLTGPLRFNYLRLYDASNRPALSDLVARRRGNAGSVANASESVYGKVVYSPDLGTDALKAVQASDTRLGRVKGETSSTIYGPYAKVAVEAGAGITVAISEDALNDKVIFTIGQLGGSFPGYGSGTPTADNGAIPAGTGLAGSSGLAAKFDHQHPLSTDYKIRIAYTTVGNGATSISLNLGFTPRVAILLSNTTANAFTASIGVGVGDTSAHQFAVGATSVAPTTVPVAKAGAMAADNTTTWAIASGDFTSSLVRVTRTGGIAETFFTSGAMLIVIGDKLP